MITFNICRVVFEVNLNHCSASILTALFGKFCWACACTWIITQYSYHDCLAVGALTTLSCQSLHCHKQPLSWFLSLQVSLAHSCVCICACVWGGCYTVCSHIWLLLSASCFWGASIFLWILVLLSFYWWVLFHCKDRPRFVYSYSCWWTF